MTSFLIFLLSLTERPPSPDKVFQDEDGNDTEELRYRTAPFTDFQEYRELDRSHRLHWEEINETQIKLYLTGTYSCFCFG